MMSGLPRRVRKQIRSVVLFALLVATFLAFIIVRHDYNRHHEVAQSLAHYTPEKATLSPEDARSMCRTHGFSLYKDRHRKVYDLSLVATELDWLEIRLNTLGPYVDYFIVVESETTFTSKPKPLYLQENWARFKDFHHKIVYKVVHDPIVSSRIWDHEDWFRDSLMSEVFPELVGTPAGSYVAGDCVA
jgi:beta-1,4-mannosyl-glycoprotein beta-1,4-N-acetylglucosaminyltransferase